MVKILSPEKIQKIDDYLNSTKELSRGDHQKWRILKKAIPIIWNFENSDTEKVSDEVTWASIAIDSIEKLGIPNSISALLIIEE